MLRRTFRGVGNKRYSRGYSRNRSRALRGGLSDVSEFFARRVLIKSGIGVNIATVLTVFITALGSDHEEISRNDRRSLCGFDNLKSRTESVCRGMTRARNHAVHVARLKHKRAVHGVILCEGFSRKFDSHTLCLAKFGQKLSVFFGFFIGFRVDYRNAGKIGFGVVLFDFFGIAEKGYSRHALFNGNCGSLDNSLILPLGKNDVLVEFDRSFFDVVKYF